MSATPASVRLPLLFTAVFALAGCATVPSGARSYSETEQKPDSIPATVLSFLDEHGTDLSSLENSDRDDLSVYRTHRREYVVDIPVEELWEHYRSMNPDTAWATGMTSPGVVYDPDEGISYTPGQKMPPFATGQVYVLELEIAGMYRLPVAFRLTRLDDESRAIEFTYLKVNKSNGFQRIELVPWAGPGTSAQHDASSIEASLSGDSRHQKEMTLVVHSSWFRSDSPLRDALLYAPFHTLFVDSFHSALAERNGYTLRIGVLR